MADRTQHSADDSPKDEANQAAKADQAAETEEAPAEPTPDPVQVGGDAPPKPAPPTRKYDDKTLNQIRGLGIYFAVLSVSLVIAILALWPALETLESVNPAEEIAAEVVEEMTQEFKELLAAQAKLAVEAADESADAGDADPSDASSRTDDADGEPTNDASPTPAPAPATDDDSTSDEAKSTEEDADGDDSGSLEAEVPPEVEPEPPTSRRILILVLLVAMLGSVVGASSSFVSYVGNGTFKNTWIWWYRLRPLIGAVIGMILYFLIQAGFLETPGVALQKGELESLVYQSVAIAALAGLFSKITADKLEQIFLELLPSNADDKREDKLNEEQNSEGQNGKGQNGEGKNGEGQNGKGQNGKGQQQAGQGG